MSADSFYSAELLQLCGKLRDQSLTDAESQRLSEVLVAHPEARRFYLKFMGITSLLESHAQVQVDEAHEENGHDADSQVDLLLELLKQEEAAEVIESIETQQADQRSAEPASNSQQQALTFREATGAMGYLLIETSKTRPAQLIAAAAAVILLALTITVLLLPVNNTSNTRSKPVASTTPHGSDPTSPFNRPQPVATLTATHNAAWSGPKPAGDLRRGDALYPNQRLTLTQGFAEITTARGAIAILEAPASIDFIDSPNALRLHSGKIVGICETESSKGFLVRTDHADITDLGTEFGVEVAGENVRVSVFSGEVRINAPGIAPKHLTASQAADVVFDGQSHEFVEHESADLAAKFTRRLPGSDLVTSARVLGVEGVTPQIVASGFFENAKPFTDRNYVLTGIDGKGLPAELLGGDLVQMPAQARFLETDKADQMRLELVTAGASDVYLLLQHKHPAPAWLERDYEQTPWQVGIFMGGERTDRFAVWKRSKPTLGRAIVAEGIDKSIYSVVIVPRNP